MLGDGIAKANGLLLLDEREGLDERAGPRGQLDWQFRHAAFLDNLIQTVNYGTKGIPNGITIDTVLQDRGTLPVYPFAGARVTLRTAIPRIDQ